jgi:hypothetical protein
MILKKILVATIFVLFVSCGKSPLQLKKSNNEEINGKNSFESAQKFEVTGHQLDLVWLSPINSNEVGHFLLIAKKNNIASDLPSGFSVILWMPSMGHGSSPVTISRLGAGIYDISRVYFIMDGEWQVRVQLKDGASLLEEINFTYNL